MLASLERVLPREMNESVAFTGSSFTKMCGSWYIFRGAGWCMTSVFLVLMVNPKLSQALEKLFTH